MPTATVTQTVAGAGQFTAAAGAGLFQFTAWDQIPASTRIVLSSVSYATLIGAAGNITMMLRRVVVGPTTERALLLRALQADITGPDGDADVRACGVVVPREADGTHWELAVTTVGKAVTGTVSVDFQLCTFPDTTDRDSERR